MSFLQLPAGVNLAYEGAAAVHEGERLAVTSSRGGFFWGLQCLGSLNVLVDLQKGVTGYCVAEEHAHLLRHALRHSLVRTVMPISILNKLTGSRLQVTIVTD